MNVRRQLGYPGRWVGGGGWHHFYRGWDQLIRVSSFLCNMSWVSWWHEWDDMNEMTWMVWRHFKCSIAIYTNVTTLATPRNDVITDTRSSYVTSSCNHVFSSQPCFPGVITTSCFAEWRHHNLKFCDVITTSCLAAWRHHNLMFCWVTSSQLHVLLRNAGLSTFGLARLSGCKIESESLQWVNEWVMDEWWHEWMTDGWTIMNDEWLWVRIFLC